jgi:hypothetical protein
VPEHTGGLASWWWDFSAIGEAPAGDLADVDDIGAAWGEQATSEADIGDSGGKTRLYEPKHFDTPIRIDHKRWLEEAGFRGHAQAVLHICEQTRYDWQARLAWHGDVEDPLMIVIVWLLEETRRTGRNPAAETGHWPDANDFVCKQARRAITAAIRHEAPTKATRPRDKDGKRYWRKPLQISPVSPQVTESDEPDEYVVPPWDIENVRNRPNNAPAPAWTVPGAQYEASRIDKVRQELTAILVRLVHERIAADDPKAARVYEMMLINTGEGTDGHWSLSEVAEATGIPRSTVKRAVERFKKDWEENTKNWTWR